MRRQDEAYNSYLEGREVSMNNARAIAAEVISTVLKQQRSLDVLLEKLPEHKDLGLIKELCFGTLRYFYRLNIIASSLLNKPIPNKYFDVHCVLLIGLYQLLYLKTPDHAAVSESVNAVVSLNKVWAKGLINKTLRLFITNPDSYLKIADQTEEGLYAHPQWFIGKVKKAYPEQYQNILAYNNRRAPLTLRVNQQKITTAAYLKLLIEQDIPAKIIELAPSAIQLETAVSVNKLPGFFNGLCSVQDLSGQLAAVILQPKPGERILDACAAPGSKTTHLLEVQPDLKELVAIDINEERLTMLHENLQRLQLDSSTINIITQDAAELSDNELFDAILLDAPCSGTGVLRRHPDIKVLRHPEDVIPQVVLQAELLTKLWSLLKPGGSLLYSTCSVLPEENEKQIVRFLDQHADAKSTPLSLGLGFQLAHGLQILPGDHDADGFYYCLLNKC